MKKCVFVFAIIFLVFDVSFVAAQDRELVGFTATPTTGSNQGIAGMHELCRSEFPGSRMCTTSDIVRNGVSDEIAGLLSNSWIHPAAVVEVTADAEVGINKGIWLDSVSGARSSGDSRGMLSCFGWTATGSQVRGLAILPTGSLQESNCSNARPVACCAATKKK